MHHFAISKLVRAIRKKAIDALDAAESDDKATAKVINGYMITDFKALQAAWASAGAPPQALGNLGRHIHFGDAGDYRDILAFDLFAVEEAIEDHLLKAAPPQTVHPKLGFESLLHPAISRASLPHFRNGDLRNAVLDSLLALGDLIRSRTGSQLDGRALVTETLSLDRPKLVLSDISSESGKNDQKGFMEIMSGAFIGVRNPKAHTLAHDLDAEKAAQYLVFSSLLARRISDARPPA